MRRQEQGGGAAKRAWTHVAEEGRGARTVGDDLGQLLKSGLEAVENACAVDVLGAEEL